MCDNAFSRQEEFKYNILNHRWYVHKRINWPFRTVYVYIQLIKTYLEFNHIFKGNEMKSKITFFLTLCLLSIKPSIANISEFEYCKLLVFVSGCNISRDNNAPKFIKHGGKAACFVALDIAIEHKQRGKDIIEKIISENNYKREKYTNKISEFKKDCSSSMSALQQCDLGFVRAKGIQTIDQCKNLIKIESAPSKSRISPKPNLSSSKIKPKQANHIYELKLSKGWRLADSTYKNDFVMNKYTDNKDSSILLRITKKLDKSGLDSFLKMTNKNLKEHWSEGDIELISNKVIDIGTHKSVKEQIGYEKGLKRKSSIYILKGKNRLAWISISSRAKKIDITKTGRKIVKSFIWK